MKKKFNPDLLKEELKKFKMLSEYDFYQEKKESPEYKDLILGDIEEDDDKADDKAPDDLQAADTSNAGGAAVDIDDKGDDAETTGDIPEPTEEPEAAAIETPTEEPKSDDVEVDVTSLVKGSEEAKHSADLASHNSELLLQKLTDLETRVASMDKIGAKIDDIEKEIVKRNPTPVEKLEMRSLSSYPYSQKLTDYWADKKGPYDVMGNDKEKKEYTLTKDDVDSDYSDINVRKSFAIDPEKQKQMDKDYEEEDDKDYNEEDI
jgi:hypothetical protein